MLIQIQRGLYSNYQSSELHNASTLTCSSLFSEHFIRLTRQSHNTARNWTDRFDFRKCFLVIWYKYGTFSPPIMSARNFMLDLTTFLIQHNNERLRFCHSWHKYISQTWSHSVMTSSHFPANLAWKNMLGLTTIIMEHLLWKHIAVRELCQQPWEVSTGYLHIRLVT